MNVKLGDDDGSEHQNGNATLNVKLRGDTDGSERRNETTAPNAKPKGTSMNVNLK